tara:strand:- start:5368 stop:5976 length:609 start_codon:yes stop_codon:yes gene_type:complete
MEKNKSFSDIEMSPVEDRHTDGHTLSVKFKRDIWDRCEEFGLGVGMTCVELGHYTGYVTKVLANIFGNVITVDSSKKYYDISRRVNANLDNIEYVQMNLYTESLDAYITNEAISLFVIDAGHSQQQVMMDIDRCLRFNLATDSYIIFDDYPSPDIRKAVDAYITNGKIEMIYDMGCPAGHSFKAGATISHSEGVMCKIVQND